MKLKDQVCSLELARKLKELGVKQKSYWFWQYNGNNHLLPEYTLECGRAYGISKKDCRAFTVAELGEMLKGFMLPYWSGSEKDWIWNDNGSRIHSDTEANARAKMLIYLLENKLIEET